jgi:hypothetical protein
MRKILLPAALLLFWASGAALAAPKNPYAKYAQRQSVPVTVWGYSDKSCASVVNGVSATQRTATELYVLGLWSGLNLGEDVNAGGTTDGPGVMGEVELECQAHPSENIVDAILSVRRRFITAGK